MDKEPAPSDLPKTSQLLETVRLEAAELRNFTITFLTLLLYVSLIVSATDHEQILRVSPVVLPLLNINIPILGFYWLMPPFLFFMHLYVLVQHYLFSQLAFRFADALRQEPDEIQNNIRRSFGNLPFLHWLLGRHGPMMQTVMTLITAASLIVWPLFMFWWLQARFLPYHDSDLVFWQQCWLTAEVITLAYFWAKIMDEHDNPWHWWKQTGSIADGIQYLTIELWQLTKTRWQHWLDAIPSDNTAKSLQQHSRNLLIAWRHSRSLFSNRRPSIKTVLKNGWGLLVRGSARIILILFFATAQVFSWMVSLVPDSQQEQSVIKSLLWLEQLSYQVTSSKEPAGAENDRHNRHWLLENVNLSKKSWGLNQERLIFVATARLHEKRLLASTSENKLKIQEYDLARVLEVECPSQRAQFENKIVSADPNSTPQIDSETIQEPEKCFQIDSYLPRNLLLRNQVITADRELKPELVAALQAADSNKTTATQAAEPNPDILQQIKPINLQGRHFEYADFTGSSFPKAILNQTNFNHSDLTSTRIDNALITNASFQEAILKAASLQGATIKFTRLGGADMNRTRLSSSELSDIQLENTRLVDTHMERVTIHNLHLEGARLIGLNLEGATLKDSHLEGAGLFGVHMEGANLSEAHLEGSTLSNTHLEGATLSNAHLEGASLNNVHLELAELEFTHMEGASLRLVNLQGANLTNAYLAAAIVTELPEKYLNATETEKLISKLKKIVYSQAASDRLNKLAHQHNAPFQISEIFTKINNDDSTGQKISCVSDISAITGIKGPCISMKASKPDKLDAIYQYWLALACQDDTGQKWLAQSLSKRAASLANPWPGLGQLFSVALQNADQCPGLAGMPKNYKQMLQNPASGQETN